MNAKELRIGNHVSHINDPIVEKPGLLIVRELRYNSARVEYQFEGKMRTSLVNYSELVGKQLTHEWLVKSGFEEEEYTYNYNIDDTLSIQLLNVNGVYFPSLIECPEMSLCAAQIVHLQCVSFIHEIQNIYFALKGEELEINQIISEK